MHSFRAFPSFAVLRPVACRRVHAVRPWVMPNPGFTVQLQKFEEMGCDCSQWRAWRHTFPHTALGSSVMVGHWPSGELLRVPRAARLGAWCPLLGFPRDCCSHPRLLARRDSRCWDGGMTQGCLDCFNNGLSWSPDTSVALLSNVIGRGCSRHTGGQRQPCRSRTGAATPQPSPGQWGPALAQQAACLVLHPLPCTPWQGSSWHAACCVLHRLPCTPAALAQLKCSLRQSQRQSKLSHQSRRLPPRRRWWTHQHPTSCRTAGGKWG